MPEGVEKLLKRGETPMAIVTYGATTPTVEAPARRKSLFIRFFDAFAEARMKQAYREIARYRHLLPQELEEAAAVRLGPRTEDDLPFTTEPVAATVQH
jgi:hypothetical protein